MRSVTLSSLVIVSLFTRAVHAEVTDQQPQGFTVTIDLNVQATPQQVYRQLVENIAQWWEPSHTFSGDAKNLYLEAEPKGWFGERLPEGGIVQHMEVLFAAPGKVLRMRGALGPLQEHAVTGVMTWTMKEESGNTTLSLVYRVGGYLPGGVDKYALPVDHVLSTQVTRLKRLVEKGSAE